MSTNSRSDGDEKEKKTTSAKDESRGDLSKKNHKAFPKPSNLSALDTLCDMGNTGNAEQTDNRDIKKML